MLMLRYHPVVYAEIFKCTLKLCIWSSRENIGLKEYIEKASSYTFSLKQKRESEEAQKEKHRKVVLELGFPTINDNWRTTML